VFNVASTDEVGITLQVHASKNRTKLLLPEFFADLKIMNPHSGEIIRATKSFLGCMKLGASIYVGREKKMMMMMEKTENMEET
jgi:hypothetical protein